MSKLIDRVGQRFGLWTVIARAPSRHKTAQTCWLCRCDCGTEREVIGQSLVRGKSASCGCAKTPYMVGTRIGHLTVLCRVPQPVLSTDSSRWVCVCDCSAQVERRGSTLRRYLAAGYRPSCGCSHNSPLRTHGMGGTPEYGAWTNAKTRCFNAANAGYVHYGARGITMCDEWRNSFEAFYAHVGPRPSAKHSLDRIDNGGDYAPGNVRWALPAVQQANKRHVGDEQARIAVLEAELAELRRMVLGC